MNSRTLFTTNMAATTVVVNESEELVKYFEANGDFSNTAAPAMITATDVNALMNSCLLYTSRCV